MTGDLVTKTGTNAIRQSIKNIILTSFYERGFNVEFGSGMSYQLFETIDLLSLNVIKNTIKQSIKNFEPDVNIQNVIINESGNSVDAVVIFTVYNKPEQLKVSINITKV